MSEFGTESAWSYALTLLSRRAYTEAQIEERLKKRGASEETVSATLRKLEEYRLVDDEAFSEAFVRNYRGRKGTIAMRHDLLRKGVSEALVERSLSPLGEQEQLKDAISLLERNRWRFQGEDERRNRARAYAFLARRGFPAEIATNAIEALAVHSG